VAVTDLDEGRLASEAIKLLAMAVSVRVEAVSVRFVQD
jgi:hypothetical protein